MGDSNSIKPAGEIDIMREHINFRVWFMHLLTKLAWFFFLQWL